MIFGIGNKETRANEISGAVTAAWCDWLFGHDYGVLDMCTVNFAASAQAGTQGNNKICIGAGYVYAYGYIGVTANVTSFDILRPAKRQYWYIYAEIDTASVPNKFTVKAINNQSATDIRLRQDNLRSVGTGVFCLPLYMVEMNPTGDPIITNKMKYKTGGTIYTGVIAKIGKAASASYAEDVSGSIAASCVAVTQTAGTADNTVATCAFACRAVDNAINS